MSLTLGCVAPRRTLARTALVRTALVAGGTALLVGLPVLPALPAWAATAPTAATALNVTIGNHVADLAWTDGDGTSAIVRDVSGLAASAITITAGRPVPVTSATTAHDIGFKNAPTTTYAVWSTASDGTPSDTALIKDVAAAPVVPTAMTLALSVAVQRQGLPVTAAGRLTRAGVALSGATVTLRARRGGTNIVFIIRRLVTAADGTVRTTFVPDRTWGLTLDYAGDAFSARAVSPIRIVRLLPRLTTALAPTTIVKGETAVVSGSMRPAVSGAAILLQLHNSTGWHTQQLTHTSSTGAYAFRVAPAIGVYAFRAVIVGSPGWLQLLGAPVVLTVNARNLVYGNTGADVLALQRRLTALHYLPGALDGVFGRDLLHAVYAFQKVERLSRTGAWTKAERFRVAHPTGYVVRYGSSGRSFEVDVTRQVIVYSVNHVVTLIADVSTGGEYRYTSQGVTSVAHTPRGRFFIERKFDGVQISPLGYLYRPSYFYRGYAVHGEGYDVPPRPVSHGCVRVTNHNADILYPLLTRGIAITIFDE